MTLPALHGALWAWVQSLPQWQSDLLRRLTVLEEVSQEELRDACQMVLTALGVPCEAPVVPVPIPALVPPAAHRVTKILSLSDLVSVGCVEAGQRMEFGSDGLTITFGETGSGKSSYARVLRKACRASARPVEILPNVLKAGPGVGQARAGTAQIEVSVDGATNLIRRDVNSAPESALSEVTVFDSDCADVYADCESEITYTPAILRLFERLVSFQLQIRKLVEEEIESLDARRVSTAGFDPSTKAGALVGALTENVNPATVSALATVTKEEKAGLDELRVKVATAKANDPLKLASLLERRAETAERLEGRLDELARAVDRTVVTELLTIGVRTAEMSALSATLSAALSAAAARPVGDATWTALWAAAHAYVAHLGQAGEAFPPAPGEAAALCPLCQQPLGEDAVARLRRFEEFFRGEAENTLRELEAKRAAVTAGVAKVPGEVRELGEQARLLLGEDAPLEALVSDFIASVAARASAIVSSASQTTIDAPPLTADPGPRVREFAAGLRLGAADQKALATPDAIDKAAREIAELENRVLLAPQSGEILARIDTLKRVSKLRGVSAALVTTGLSRKISEFTESAVTAQLRAGLAAELQALQCAHIPVAIGARGMKGKTRVALQLDATRSVDVADVLSEGERRAVALSFFLAEVAASDHGGGIVLDDPVSSLDHARRSYVARRLLEEASRRQTIVFTHDVVFLLELQDLAARASVPCEVRVVRRVGDAAGIASAELPWVAQNVAQRIRWLRNDMQRLGATERRGDAEQYRREAKTWFELLREAWERTVEEKVFNGVVTRFQPGIQTLRLAPVTVTPAMTKAVERGMTCCSAWTHDQAPALARPPPTAADLESALDELETFVAQFKK